MVQRTDLVLTSVRTKTDERSPGPDSDLMCAVRLWTELVRPGGFVVAVVRPTPQAHGPVPDLTSEIGRIAGPHGLIAVDRCVALTRCARRQRSSANTKVRSVRLGHLDVVVMRAAGPRGTSPPIQDNLAVVVDGDRRSAVGWMEAAGWS